MTLLRQILGNRAIILQRVSNNVSKSFFGLLVHSAPGRQIRYHFKILLQNAKTPLVWSGTRPQCLQ